MRRPLVLVLLLALVGLGACGNSVRPPAATVNGRDISQEALEEELRAVQSNREYVEAIEQGGRKVRGAGSDTLDLQFVGALLTRQIFFELVHQELVRRKLQPTPPEITAAKDDAVQSVGSQAVFARFPEPYQRTLQRRSAELAKLMAELGDVQVDDAAIKRYYDENPDEFAETCVSHILFAVTGADGRIDQEATSSQSDALKAQAEAVRAQLAAGGDFTALAGEHSQDAGNRERGGELGCNPAGQFVPPFETAMNGLAEGEVSQPVQTQFGWHLIKVTRRQVQTLEEAEPQIRRTLASGGEEGLGEFLQSAVSKATVTVNPRYGRFDKGEDGQAPGIVPPDAPTTTEAGGPRGGGAPPPFPAP